MLIKSINKRNVCIVPIIKVIVGVRSKMKHVGYKIGSKKLLEKHGYRTKLNGKIYY